MLSWQQAEIKRFFISYPLSPLKSLNSSGDTGWHKWNLKKDIYLLNNCCFFNRRTYSSWNCNHKIVVNTFNILTLSVSANKRLKTSSFVNYSRVIYPRIWGSSNVRQCGAYESKSLRTIGLLYTEISTNRRHCLCIT